MAGMDTLSERLAWARKKKGISQTALAVACGWEGHTRISNYENGKEPENLDAIERLAAGVGVAVEWLTFGVAPGVLLSADERRLLKAFRKAADTQRNAVLALLDPEEAHVVEDDPGSSDEPITEDMFGSSTKSHDQFERTMVKAQAMNAPLRKAKRVR